MSDRLGGCKYPQQENKLRWFHIGGVTCWYLPFTMSVPTSPQFEQQHVLIGRAASVWCSADWRRSLTFTVFRWLKGHYHFIIIAIRNVNNKDQKSWRCCLICIWLLLSGPSLISERHRGISIFRTWRIIFGFNRFALQLLHTHIQDMTIHQVGAYCNYSLH